MLGRNNFVMYIPLAIVASIKTAKFVREKLRDSANNYAIVI